jgi:hypothetical protein
MTVRTLIYMKTVRVSDLAWRKNAAFVPKLYPWQKGLPWGSRILTLFSHSSPWLSAFSLFHIPECPAFFKLLLTLTYALNVSVSRSMLEALQPRPQRPRHTVLILVSSNQHSMEIVSPEPLYGRQEGPSMASSDSHCVSCWSSPLLLEPSFLSRRLRGVGPP